MEYHFDNEGVSPEIFQIPSPYFNERPDEEDISLIVIHGISLPAGHFGTSCVRDLFTGNLDCTKPGLEGLVGLEVSSHFFIKRTGDVIQFVPCRRRAWHAGVSEFDGRQNCNDFSIGIELEGTDFVPYEDVQYEKLADLINSLQKAYPIKAITSHSHIAPKRKTDPGAYFDWEKLRGLLKQEQTSIVK